MEEEGRTIVVELEDDAFRAAVADGDIEEDTRAF